MPKALVTGANGFIGSHLVRALLARGYDVSCLVRHTSRLASLEGLPVSLHIGDVHEPATLDAPTEGVDYIFHLAAALLVPTEEGFRENNTEGTANLLDAAARNAAGTLKRFLYVSSQAAAGPASGPTPLTEAAEARPVSWYGDSKRQAEEIVNQWADRLPVTIVRPAAVYGEREQDISQAFGAVEARLHPKVGLRKHYVNMVYVEDVVRGIVMAAESGTAQGQTYYLAHPEVLTTGEVVKTIGRAIGKPFGLLLPIPMVLLRLAAPVAELAYYFTRNRPGLTRDKVRELSQRYWLADASKARRDFGWEARYSLLEGMRKTIPFFKAEQARLRRLDGEGGPILWLKYVVVAAVLGVVIEGVGYLGEFYTYEPWGAVFIVVLALFGLGLGTVSMALRTKSDGLQFLTGAVLATAVEALNQLEVFPFRWVFAPGWPLGITDPWVRSVVLGLAGGVFILLINFVVRQFYKRRVWLG